MPPKYKCKLFVDLILIILVIQLRYLANIYEMARIDFDVPMIEHLQKTPIEKEVKIIYKKIPQRNVDIYSLHAVCQYCVYGGMFQ